MFAVPNQLTMLLACDAVTIQHANYAKALQFFLTQNLGIKVFLDIVEIPASQGKSPYTWYTTIFDKVDFVAVIVPPSNIPGFQRGSPYEKTLKLCLNLIENRKIAESPSAINSCFFLFVPDSEATLLPNKLNFLSKFKMPFQYLSLRQHIRFMMNGNSQNAYQRFSLPLCFFPKQQDVHASFFEIFNRISSEHAETPLLSPTVSDEVIDVDENYHDVIQQKTNQLDSDFGKHIPSVHSLFNN